jgi:hypothetical protein
VFRPAATQPLDPAAADRAPGHSGAAKTTPLSETEPDKPGLVGAVRDFVSSIFSPKAAVRSDGPTTLELPAGSGGLADSDPPSRASLNFGLVSMNAAQAPIAAAPEAPAARQAMRSWGMVTMDGTEPAPTVDATPRNGGFRSWGMVSMTDSEPAAPSAPEEPTPRSFRNWGMVSMTEPEPKPETPAKPTTPPPLPKPPVAPPKPPTDVKPPVAPPQPPVAPPKPPETPPFVGPLPPTAPPFVGPLPPTKPPTTPEPPGPPTPPAPTPTQTDPKLRVGKLDPAVKAQLLAKVKAAVSPEVAALVDKLDREGKLELLGKGGMDILSPEARTVLENLASMSDMRLSDSALSLGFKNKSILEQTIKDLADPTKIKQMSESDTVWTNLRFQLAADDPGAFAEMAYLLHRDGRVNLKGGGVVELQDALKPFDLGPQVGKVWYQDGQLWMQYKGFPPMSADKFITDFLHNKEWIERLLSKNAIFNNPVVRGLIDNIRQMWDEGRREEVMQTVAPFVDMYLQMKPDEPGHEGIRYALDNLKSLFRPATQAGEAMPKGLALGRVDEFYPGLKGYYADDALLKAVDSIASKGAAIPIAFTTDDGKGLHMASILGKVGDRYYIYDPENGPRSMPIEVLKERAVAAFFPPTMAGAFKDIPDSDTRPVGGGRFTWRGVGG